MHLTTENMAELVRYVIRAERENRRLRDTVANSYPETIPYVRSTPSPEIEAIKAIRSITGIGLAGAKELVEAVKAPMKDPLIAAIEKIEVTQFGKQIEQHIARQDAQWPADDQPDDE